MTNLLLILLLLVGCDEDKILKNVRQKLTEAVRCRMFADRPICCLLSGGLDSSLTTALLAQEIYNQRKDSNSQDRFKLKTFCIGMENGTDLKYARMVAEHLQRKFGEYVEVIHKEIKLTKQDFLDALPKIVEITESYDVTTIRASTGQYLVSKWIADNSNDKVIFIGDGADEVCCGYLMFNNAPNHEAFFKGNTSQVAEIYLYDVLRADRCISENGLEARVPFLDHRFVDYYLSIDPQFKEHGKGKMEKYTLRKAFEGTDILPREVLWRRKEAFSDGVSSQEEGWYKTIQRMVNKMYSDKYLVEERNKILNIAKNYIEKNDLKFDILAGGETAGIPYASFLSQILNKPMIYVRKKPKDFGKNKQIEGDFNEGQKVILIEDLATDGGSKIDFLKSLRNSKLIVSDIFVFFYYDIFDLNKSALGSMNVKLHSLCTWKDIIKFISDNNIFTSEKIENLKFFLNDPNLWRKNNE